MSDAQDQLIFEYKYIFLTSIQILVKKSDRKYKMEKNAKKIYNRPHFLFLSKYMLNLLLYSNNKPP